MKLYEIIKKREFVEGNRIIVDSVVVSPESHIVREKIRFSYYIARRFGPSICCQILRATISTEVYDLIAEVAICKNDLAVCLFNDTESKAESTFDDLTSIAGKSYDKDLIRSTFGGFMTLKTAICHNIPPILLTVL